MSSSEEPETSEKPKKIYLDNLNSSTDDVYKNNYVGYKCLKINNDSIILNKKDSVIEIIITKRINNGYGGSDEVKMTFLRKLRDSLCFNDDQFNDVLKNFTNTKFPPEDDNTANTNTDAASTGAANANTGAKTGATSAKDSNTAGAQYIQYRYGS